MIFIKTVKVIIFIILIMLLIGSCSKKNDVSPSLCEDQYVSISPENIDDTSFDVSVDINIKVSVDSSIKDINTNIIKAARTAVFDYHCTRAKQSQYDEYDVNEQMIIFEINKKGEKTWEVKYRGEDDSLDVYHFVTVEKEDSGSYIGNMFYSNPLIKGDETY